MTKRFHYGNRKPVVVPLGLEIQANRDHVVMVFPFDASALPAGGKGTIGIRFVSPEHLLSVFQGLVEAAATVWPNHPLMREYKEGEE